MFFNETGLPFVIPNDASEMLCRQYLQEVVGVFHLYINILVVVNFLTISKNENSVSG